MATCTGQHRRHSYFKLFPAARQRGWLASTMVLREARTQGPPWHPSLPSSMPATHLDPNSSSTQLNSNVNNPKRQYLQSNSCPGQVYARRGVGATTRPDLVWRPCTPRGSRLGREPPDVTCSGIPSTQPAPLSLCRNLIPECGHRTAVWPIGCD